MGFVLLSHFGTIENAAQSLSVGSLPAQVHTAIRVPQEWILGVNRREKRRVYLSYLKVSFLCIMRSTDPECCYRSWCRVWLSGETRLFLLSSAVRSGLEFFWKQIVRILSVSQAGNFHRTGRSLGPGLHPFLAVTGRSGFPPNLQTHYNVGVELAAQ